MPLGLMPAPGAMTPPGGPSAMTPPGQPGMQASAMLKVRQAVVLLSSAVGQLGGQIGGDLGKAVLSALKTLSPHAPGAEEGLGQSELASMQQGQQAVRPAPPMMGGGPRPMPMMGGTPPMQRGIPGR